MSIRGVVIRSRSRDVQINELEDKIEKLKKVLWHTRKELSKVERFEYGSYSSGNLEWSDKWKSSAGKRVLFLANVDHAGSLYDWAKAVNKYTTYAVRVVSFNKHKYNFPQDLVFPNPKYADSDIEKLLKEADILHIKDESGFFNNKNNLPLTLISKQQIPRVFTHYGGQARKFKDDKRYRKFVEQFDARVAITPDLCYPWFKGEFIPHAININKYKYSWKPGELITHSPSRPHRKGTSSFENALKAISDNKFTLDIITDQDYTVCQERKKNGAFFFDQAGKEEVSDLGINDVIGWYGKSAVESMAYGIPTFAHLSNVALEQSGLEPEKIPIFNLPLETDGMISVLKNVMNLNESNIRDISIATRKWAESFHSEKAVAEKLSALYKKLLT